MTASIYNLGNQRLFFNYMQDALPLMQRMQYACKKYKAEQLIALNS